MDTLTFSVVARYKAKKRLESGNVLYEYSDRAVLERNKRKARRLEKLGKNIKHLRAQVKKDLTSDDREKALISLVVSLIDSTFERIGNDASAAGERNEKGEPHFGVTGWTKKHISFGKGGASATIKYVGKSAVEHTKKVTDASVVKALKKAYDECEGDDGCIFAPEGLKVDAAKVNAYLKSFGGDLTAKDLRGFHANRLTQEQLRGIRSKGGKLPEDKTEREKQLKKEFREAMDVVSKELGHGPKTLASQYLFPGLEATFLKDGTVLDKMK
jgi:DNA topoisomerase IB